MAEDRIVILSTHIVEDVANLCSRFAVIRDGRIIADTSPSAAKAEIEGTLFEGDVAVDQLNDFQSSHNVARAILVEGKNRVRIKVQDASQAPLGFVAVQPTFRRCLSADDEPGRALDGPRLTEALQVPV